MDSISAITIIDVKDYICFLWTFILPHPFCHQLLSLFSAGLKAL